MKKALTVLYILFWLGFWLCVAVVWTIWAILYTAVVVIIEVINERGTDRN